MNTTTTDTTATTTGMADLKDDVPAGIEPRQPRTFTHRLGTHTQTNPVDEKPTKPTRKVHELISLYAGGQMHSLEAKLFLKSLCNITVMEAYQALKLHAFAVRRGEDSYIATLDERNAGDNETRDYESVDGTVSEFMTDASGHEVRMRHVELAERLLTLRNWAFQELEGYEEILGETVRFGDGTTMYRAPIKQHELEKLQAYSEFQPQSFEAHMLWAHSTAGNVNEERLMRTLTEMQVPADDIVERRMIREMQAESAKRLQARLIEMQHEILSEADSLAVSCEEVFGTLPRQMQERILNRLIVAVQRARLRFIRNAEMADPANKAEAISDVAILRGFETTLRTFAQDCGLNPNVQISLGRMAERNKMSPKELVAQLKGRQSTTH